LKINGNISKKSCMIAKGLINLKQENLRFPEKSCLIKQTQFYWGFHGLVRNKKILFFALDFFV